jgi:hypothetical protein
MMRFGPACLGAALTLLAVTMRPALADGCDLSRLVGYTLEFDKAIDSYIEEGKSTRGFDGCNRDRVIVFADHSGVRCVDTFLHSAGQVHGYLFARSNTDLMLCVDGDLYKVAPAN